MRQVHPLRALTAEETHALHRVAKATSERLDMVKRAQALLAVQAGRTYTQAAHAAGYKSGDTIRHLVERFNQDGLAALHIATGRGRKATYTADQREHILHAMQRSPDRQTDGTATWSLSTLQRALRQTALPQVSTFTIHRVLHEVGYRFGKTRTWCTTGTVLRVRQGKSVAVTDPCTAEKNA